MPNKLVKSAICSDSSADENAQLAVGSEAVASSVSRKQLRKARLEAALRQNLRRRKAENSNKERNK